MGKEKLNAERKRILEGLEEHLCKSKKPEDRMFYHHPDEGRIVLSHTIFWVMTKQLVKSLPYEIQITIKKPKTGKYVSRLRTIAVVAAGYGGDMSDELAWGMLDDMDFLNSRVWLLFPYDMLYQQIAV